ncbi:MAG TPA: hypothetical protein VMW17_18430 [Candidatus Binatia bacterium]|nr:hypothetical protein [Candidatus Binatia bacterium]
MPDSAVREHLRRRLGEHLTELGYSWVRSSRGTLPVPEIVRVSPVRRRIAYGETVLRSDLGRRRCHERLLCFSQRRTRRRSSILFFIGVAAGDEVALEALLQELDIRSRTRGGHVHVVPITPSAARRRPPNRETGK